MLLRDAAESDVEPLARTHIAAWQVAYRGLLPDDYLDNISLEKRCNMWRGYVADPNCTIILAMEATDVLGFASFAAAHEGDVDPTTTADLMTFYVHPDHWRKGIGLALWKEAHRRMRSKFTECIVWVFRDNKPARSFYERMGFQFEGKEQLVPWLKPSPPEVRYRRAL